MVNLKVMFICTFTLTLNDMDSGIKQKNYASYYVYIINKHQTKKTNKRNMLTTKTTHNRHNQSKRVNEIMHNITKFY